MEYKKSAIFSNQKKIDTRNLCLYIKFKNETLDSIQNMLKLLNIYLVENFNEDFVLDMEFNEEPVNSKSMTKIIQDISKIAVRNINFIYDGILKSKDLNTKSQYRNLIRENTFAENFDNDEINLDLEKDDVYSIIRYILNNLSKQKEDYLGEALPQDIGLTLNANYLEDKNYQGYSGYLSFNISGYILDYNYDYYIEYLINFVKSISEVMKSICGNIFISTNKSNPNYLDLFREDIENKDLNYEESNLLEGIEGINFIPHYLFDFINNEIIDEDFLKIERHKDSIFININKPLYEVSISDKYRLRYSIEPILKKGYCENDLISFINIFREVPIYQEEIFIMESPESVENESLGIEEDFYSKYFILTKNKNSNDLDEMYEDFKIYNLSINEMNI